jgi:hypothetical protein
MEHSETLEGMKTSLPRVYLSEPGIDGTELHGSAWQKACTVNWSIRANGELEEVGFDPSSETSCPALIRRDSANS